MFGPYRMPPEPQRVDDRRVPHEEITLGWALVVLGCVRMIVAIATGEPWGPEVTIAALLIPAGIHLLVRT